jgi:uncharacterized protein YdhG (YjbR/CyaY superfamily)
MKKDSNKPAAVDDYIAGFAPEIQRLLKQVRNTIRTAVPKARETISYGMPAFLLEGPVVYFAAFKHHIGFYPTSSGTRAFKKELSSYKGAKGSVQFPLDQPMPLNLIAKMARFRVKENLERAKARSKQRR